MDRRTNAARADAPPAPMRPLRIVIADDDRDAVLMLTTLLRDEGHEVHIAYTGDGVMPLMREVEPDVVILDIAMPGQSGFTVAREIAALPGTRPLVIALTGKYISRSDRMLSEIVGFDHHLLKPYDPQDLMVLLEARQRELRLVASRQPVKPRQLL